jgi:hypothetical protein
MTLSQDITKGAFQNVVFFMKYGFVHLGSPKGLIFITTGRDLR